MKATAPPPAKRRRGPRLAVLALVFCSLLVPIAFLFNRFPAVYVTDERPQQEIDLPSFAGIESGGSVVKRDSAGVIGGNVEAQDSSKISRSSEDSHNGIDTDPSSISTKPKGPVWDSGAAAAAVTAGIIPPNAPW